MTIKLTAAQSLCLRAISHGRAEYGTNPTVVSLIQKGYLARSDDGQVVLSERGKLFCGTEDGA